MLKNIKPTGKEITYTAWQRLCLLTSNKKAIVDLPWPTLPPKSPVCLLLAWVTRSPWCPRGSQTFSTCPTVSRPKRPSPPSWLPSTKKKDFLAEKCQKLQNVFEHWDDKYAWLLFSLIQKIRNVYPKPPMYIWETTFIVRSHTSNWISFPFLFFRSQFQDPFLGIF